MIEARVASNGTAATGHAVIDAAIHNDVPSSKSLFKYLPEYWVEHMNNTLFKGPTEERQIPLEELGEIDAAACCGTAAVITLISKIADDDRVWEFGCDERWQKLYDKLVGIQTATEEDPFEWRYEIKL